MEACLGGRVAIVWVQSQHGAQASVHCAGGIWKQGAPRGAGKGRELNFAKVWQRCYRRPGLWAGSAQHQLNLHHARHAAGVLVEQAKCPSEVQGQMIIPCVAGRCRPLQGTAARS